VGFPEETKEDFNDTLEVVSKCQFDGAFTFIFSPREGTPAAKMNDTISLEEKEERLQILNEKVNEYSKKSNLKMLNTVQKVLITGVSEKDKSKVCGYTENMKLVNVEAPASCIGNIIDVKITDAKSFSLDGIILQ
jgi:tRNA-2-methylthio-N6-dimethylallyladenosine synthase